MDETAVFWGNALAIVLSLAAIIFCFYIYQQYRLRKSAIGWLALSISLAIILARRLLVLWATNDIGISQWMDSYEWLILAAISVLQLYAFWKMMGAYGEERKLEINAVDRLLKLKEKHAGKIGLGQNGKKR